MFRNSRATDANASVILTGANELREALWALPNKVFKKCLVGASKRAMQPVITQARWNAPMESGALKNSIGVKSKSYRRQGTVVTVVGAQSGFAGMWEGKKRDPAFYSHLIEGGHRVVAAHSMTMVPKKHGSGLTKLRGSGTVLAHVPAMPFLRPALHQHRHAVVSKLKEELAAFIQKEAKKDAKSSSTSSTTSGSPSTSGPKAPSAGRDSAGRFLPKATT